MLSQITLAYTAAGLGESHTLNAFEIVLVGFSFVFCLLLVLSFTTSILGKVFVRISSAESTIPTGTSRSSSSEMAGDLDIEESDPHYIAVIAAAIHCVMDGRKHRIVSIRSSNSNWAAEGRRQIFSSHNLR
jgi:Na+-transporting methylmalonyl-CoA/oxaloacetate decarboxylase gamma subunit